MRLIIPAVNPKDLGDIEKLAKYFEDHYVMVNGYTGGLTALDYKEAKNSISAWSNCFPQDSIIACVSGKTFEATQQLAGYALSLGITTLCDCPLYHSDHSNLVEHVEQLAKLRGNLIIYNNATIGAINNYARPNISRDEFAEILPLIFLFKESNDEMLEDRILSRNGREHLLKKSPRIFTGSVKQYLEAHLRYDGLVAGDANIAPGLFYALTNGNLDAVPKIKQIGACLGSEDDFLEYHLSIFEFVLQGKGIIGPQGIIKPEEAPELSSEQKDTIREKLGFLTT